MRGDKKLETREALIRYLTDDLAQPMRSRFKIEVHKRWIPDERVDKKTFALSIAGTGSSWRSNTEVKIPEAEGQVLFDAWKKPEKAWAAISVTYGPKKILQMLGASKAEIGAAEEQAAAQQAKEEAEQRGRRIAGITDFFQNAPGTSLQGYGNAARQTVDRLETVVELFPGSEQARLADEAKAALLALAATFSAPSPEGEEVSP